MKQMFGVLSKVVKSGQILGHEHNRTRNPQNDKWFNPVLKTNFD